MLHEALMLEIYRQALNAGALPTARPRSTESANSSERCPSHDSNSSENGRDNNRVESGGGGGGGDGSSNVLTSAVTASALNSATFPAVPQTLPAHPPSMEAYLHMVAAAAQQYGFPLGAAAAAAAGPRLPLPLPTEAAAPFKLPLQASPNASSNNSEALDYRTNLFARAESAEPQASEEDDDYDDGADGANNPLDLSVGPRKRSADAEHESDTHIGQIQVKKIFKTDSPPAPPSPMQQTATAAAAAAAAAAAPLLPAVNPYLAAVAAANIFRSGQFPDWNGKSDLVVDPLEKMSDIVKGPRKEKITTRAPITAAAPVQPATIANAASSNVSTNSSTPVANASNEGVTKARHNIWQSHWQNKGVASSVFRCVWCKQSFSTLEALTAHMKDSKHCGVNVPPFSNLPTNERHHQQQQHHHHHHHHHHHLQQATTPAQQNAGAGHQHGHNLRKQTNANNTNAGPTAAAKNAFQYRGDAPTPLPRKLVRGQNVWLGKGVEQAMQILKCMRCGESFRSLGEMTKHMQETQHYTNILSQEQTISMKSSAAASADAKDGHNSLSSEESRTLSAVLTCKVCDKAFNSLGDLSNHMAKNNHYAEPLMQSMGGAAGNRKRPAPKKREKSLPVRKLLEMKGAQNAEMDAMEAKLQRTYDATKRMSLDGTGLGPGSDKTEAALFAERMRQYITGVKTEEASKALNKIKSPELESKNGTSKTAVTSATAGSSGSSSSVLSAIEQMFTTSFDTPTRHASLPATSPSNSSTKNTSPVASSILKRLGIDETVDYNKPLIDTSDPYFQHYRYTSSERSGSECSAETHVETRKLDAPTPDKMMQVDEQPKVMEPMDVHIKKEPDCEKIDSSEADVEMKKCAAAVAATNAIKMEIKSELEDEDNETTKSSQSNADKSDASTHNGDYLHNNNNNNTNNNNNNSERSMSSPKSTTGSPRMSAASVTATGNAAAAAAAAGAAALMLPARSPTDSHRSLTPKSPASSIKSYDGGDKKYPSDSLNALSSMFDSLGSGSVTTTTGTAASLINTNNVSRTPKLNAAESPENLSTTNSLAALRQFCVKKEKTA